MAPPMCVECEDTEAAVRCEDCEDPYCALCFAAQHHAGSRLKHKKSALVAATEASASAPTASECNGGDRAVDASAITVDVPAPVAIGETTAKGEAVTEKPAVAAESSTSASESDEDEDLELAPDEESALMREAAYVPMRLTEDERSLFNLLDASLNVSEYTDKVDVLSYRSPVKRVIHELNEIFSILSGMMIANDFRKGRRLVQSKKFEDNEEFFRQVFEIGRRYKIMNPGRCTEL